MAQLTYADREMLLQTFDSLKDEWSGTDEQLLSDASDWAKRLVPSFGFEQALLRNLVQLSNYLRHHCGAKDIVSIARGAIQFIVGDYGQPGVTDPSLSAIRNGWLLCHCYAFSVTDPSLSAIRNYE